MRVLFSSYSLYGHLLPMLPLARAAQRAGHDVVVATGGELASRVERYGLTAWRLAEPEHHGAPPGDPLWIPGPPADVSARSRAPDLVRRAEAWMPDIVVHEPIELAAPIAAARTGARHLVHSVGPMVPAAVYAFLQPRLDQLYGEWGVPDLAANLPETTYLDICPQSLQPRGPAIWKRVRQLRPATGEPAPGERLPLAVAGLPDRDMVVVTLGTVVNKDLAFYEIVLAGMRDLAISVVVTVGPGVDPTLLGPQPPHIVVEAFVPHGLLFARCRLVINHGGNGSVLAALSHGVPLLLLPQGADQFLTAAACARAGAALVVRPPHMTPGAIRRSVERLLGEPSFAACARRVQAEIAQMPTPEQALSYFDERPSDNLAT